MLRGFLFSLCLILGATAQAADDRPPNVVIIYTDDQGTRDTHAYGAEDLVTPAMDRLAAEGIRFTQSYSGAPVCSPSRACLLTGRSPQRAGVPGNVGGDRGLPPEQITLAEYLGDHGYKTALFGKWHLGEIPELSPLVQGFDEFYGHKHGCIDNYSHFFYWSGPNVHDMWRQDREIFVDDGRYFPDLIVRETYRFLEENREEPFFMYLPFNIPHYPLQPHMRHRAPYADVEEPRHSYAALVTSLDEKVGLIINKIDALGLRENTIIIFQSDHGHSVEERTMWGGGYAGPFRGHKFTLWEGGIRVPSIISWRGTLPEGEVRDQATWAADWFPTLVDLAGLPAPTHGIDGKNIRGILESANAEEPHETLHWASNKQWAVLKGSWKLVNNGIPSREPDGSYFKADDVWLSNLEEDPAERTNLAADHADLVKELTAAHEEWVKTWDE
jgi:arylsulfatase A-like enzyme